AASPSADLGGQRARLRELVGRVDVHERDLGRAMAGDGIAGDLEHANGGEEPDDLQLSRAQACLHRTETGPGVQGVHRLVLAADARDHDVGLAGARQDEPHHVGMQERHVARDGERAVAARGREPAEDAAERAAVGIAIGDHGQVQELVALGRVRHDQEIVEHRGQRVGDTLDDTLAGDVHQRLGLAAHARAATARLDHARDLHIIYMLASDGGAPSPATSRGSHYGASVMAPWRMTRGGSAVTSTTVEGWPPAVGPASRMRSRASPKYASTALAVVGGAAPVRLALGAVIAPSRWVTSARGTRWLGTLTPTVPVPAVSSLGTCAAARNTSVSGPGQCRSISGCARGGMSSTTSRSRAGASMSTSNGIEAGRPLISNTRRTAARSSAAAPDRKSVV